MRAWWLPLGAAARGPRRSRCPVTCLLLRFATPPSRAQRQVFIHTAHPMDGGGGAEVRLPMEEGWIAEVHNIFQHRWDGAGAC